MAWRNLSKEQLEETKRQFEDSGYVVQWYAMAMEVILTTLGPDWWKENCLLHSKSPDKFLQTGSQEDPSRYEHQDRVIKLGDMLYSLKDCEGFNIFTESLKRRDLGPAFFELWVANILKESDYSIEFVKEVGKKGQDYDLISKKNESIAFIEAKSRRDQVIFNEKTLLHALERARTQLPKFGPGVIFVEVADTWYKPPENQTIISETIQYFFKNKTQRVNNIVLVWHEWLKINPGRASITLFNIFTHANPFTKLKVPLEIRKITNPIIRIDQQEFKPSFW